MWFLPALLNPNLECANSVFVKKKGAWEEAVKDNFGVLIQELEQALNTGAENSQSTALQRTQYSNIYMCVVWLY